MSWWECRRPRRGRAPPADRAAGAGHRARACAGRRDGRPPPPAPRWPERFPRARSPRAARAPPTGSGCARRCTATASARRSRGPRAGSDRRPESVLHGILGLLARAQHVSAEREQLAVIGVVERFERDVIPGARAGYEGILGSPAQDAPASAAASSGRAQEVGVRDLRHCQTGSRRRRPARSILGGRLRSSRRQAELELAQQAGQPALLVGAERPQQVALVVEVRLGDGVDEAVAGGVSVIRVPRRSSGSGARVMRPACSRRSRRLVVPLEVSISWPEKSVGRSW